MTGIFVLLLSCAVALVSLDVASYHQLTKEEAVASISFAKNAEQQFRATVVGTNGTERQYELSGDLWQIDAQIIKWKKPLMGLGIKPGYRLGRITGRYYSLEQERSAERTVYELDKTTFGIDIWHWLRDNAAFPLVDALYGNASFLPMSDGALYTINLTGTGLIARPLNEPAEKAVSNWQ